MSGFPHISPFHITLHKDISVTTAARHASCPVCKEDSSYAKAAEMSQLVTCPFCETRLEIRELTKDVCEVKRAGEASVVQETVSTDAVYEDWC